MSINANNTALNEILETINELPSSKEEQSKTVDITENGTTVVTPDEGMTLSEVTVNVAIESGGGEENLWYEASKTATTMGRFFLSANIEKLPKMDLSELTDAGYLFSLSQIKTVDFYLNTEKCTKFNSVFYNCKQLEYIKGIDTSKGTTVDSIFTGCERLKTIEEPLDFSSRTTPSFGAVKCSLLEHIRFVPESIKLSIGLPSSPLLSAESIQSIIDGLAYVESSQNLTLHKDIILTDNQKQAINAKGWTLIQ